MIITFIIKWSGVHIAINYPQRVKLMLSPVVDDWLRLQVFISNLSYRLLKNQINETIFKRN